MRISKTLPFAIAMALPRTAASYAAYVLAPALMVNWLARQSWARAILLIVFLLGAIGFNMLLGMRVSITAFILELALILPFFAAVLGFKTSRLFDGRRFIRTLNLIVFAMSFVSLLEMGFPFRLPYIHYLPDFYNGGFGRGGAKIVTIIGFFGVAEVLSRRGRLSVADFGFLAVAVLNFLVPNFILGMVAGFAGLAIFARRNQAVLFAGVAALLVVAPYLQFRAETKNDMFTRTYGTNPKLYAFKMVGELYLTEPQTIFLGTGIGQYSSQPAIWASPINRVVGAHDAPDLPGLFAGEAHTQSLAPTMLRFQGNRFAIESSANKPYSGITTMLAELGLPVTILILYSAYLVLWRRSGNDFGRAAFLFFLAVNLLDPQTDSPWFGALMLATCQAIAADAVRRRALPDNSLARESGIFVPSADTGRRALPRPAFSVERS